MSDAYPHSPEVLAALKKSGELSDWIGEHHPESTQASTKAKTLAIAYFMMALEHRSAAVLLIDHGARSSAFALARSVYETWQRGLWAQYVATPAHLDRFKTQGVPTLATIASKVNQAFPVHKVAEIKTLVYEALSDYAHGGVRQIALWFGDGEIGSQHSDAQVIELLELVDLFGLRAALHCAEVAGADTVPHTSKLAELIESIKAAQAARMA